MFVKQRIQCIMKITFTHYQMHKQNDMKHKRLCLFNADFFLNILSLMTSNSIYECQPTSLCSLARLCIFPQAELFPLGP